MRHEPVKKELLEFFAIRIQSIERLEILCLLVEHPAKLWPKDEVVRRIQSTERSVKQCLESFVRHGLAVIGGNGCFRFSDSSSETAGLTLEMAKVYRERRVAVIQAIDENPTRPG